ncbi:hypothetical protein SK128_021831, partial [Halocaridina rubra]
DEWASAHFIHYFSPSGYDIDPSVVIQRALIVMCDQTSMTVAVPRRISEGVGGIKMSLSDHSCSGVMNNSHIYIKERFGRCKFKQQISPYLTTYTNYVHIGIGPSNSDDEDFDGSGYGSEDNEDDYDVSRIKVQCPVETKREYESPPSHKQINAESPAGATYKLDVFQDREHKIPLSVSDMQTSIAVNQRLYVRTVLASG